MWNLIPWKKNHPGNSGSTKLAPFEREFSRIREDFDRLLGRMWGGGPMGPAAFDNFFEQRWGLDFDETETHYVARMDAPGFEVDDFDVSVTGNHLVVKAEHKESEDGKNGAHYRYGRFERMIALPESVETEQIDARYHSGVLELQIPKGKEAQNVKRIAVKAS